MACITKLANAIAYDCDSGATGLVSALIINKADIASYDMSNDLGVAITLTPGAKAYKIDTVKRSLVVSSALRLMREHRMLLRTQLVEFLLIQTTIVYAVLFALSLTVGL